MKQKRLTKRRADIFMSYFIPLLESNLNIRDGDLASAFEECADAELQDAIDAIWWICYRRTNPSNKANGADGQSGDKSAG